MRYLVKAVLFFLISALAVSAAEVGEDGLHKTHWMQDTFLDLREDLDEANADGKRYMIIVEQRGCIYCRRMHTDIFPTPEIDSIISDNFFVVQLNMFGDREVTDFDGETLSEKDIMFKWGVNFTPTLMFFPQDVPEGVNASRAAVAQMPGAFGKTTTLATFEWILLEGYAHGISLQKHVASFFNE